MTIKEKMKEVEKEFEETKEAIIKIEEERGELDKKIAKNNQRLLQLQGKYEGLAELDIKEEKKEKKAK